MSDCVRVRETENNGGEIGIRPFSFDPMTRFGKLVPLTGGKWAMSDELIRDVFRREGNYDA